MRFRPRDQPLVGTTRERIRVALWPVQLEDGDWIWLERVRVTQVYATMSWIEHDKDVRAWEAARARVFATGEREPSPPPPPSSCSVRMDDCEKWRTVTVEALA